MANSPSVTTVDILRHGSTEDDTIFRGHTDTPLSGVGYQQMQDKIARYLEEQQSNSPWQQIISSPLQRCHKFSSDLAGELAIPLERDNGFIEIHFGDWDGQKIDDMQRQDPQLFNNVLRNPHQYHPPNSEGFEPFRQRIIKAWERLLIRYRGQHVLLVCHGGVIRSLVSHTMDTPLSALTRISVPFACLSQICIHHKAGEADWPQLMFHNYSK